MGLQIVGCGNEIWKSLVGLLPFSITHPLEKFMGEAQVHLAPGQDSEGWSTDTVVIGKPVPAHRPPSWGSFFLYEHNLFEPPNLSVFRLSGHPV